MVDVHRGPRVRKGLAATLALALLGLPLPAVVAQPSAPAAYAIPAARLNGLADFIDGVVAQQIATRDVAGAVVTVVHQGRVLFTRGYGYADLDRRLPVDPERTLFRPGSVSKLVTWVALMQQVEAGKVDLDAPVNRYLDFKIPDPKTRPIRVRDLMSHTPGFGDQGGISAGKVEDLVPYGAWLKAHIPMQMWEPGTESAYSNYGAALAGYIVERVSGMSFYDYTEQRIFQPLGMPDTTFREPLPARLAGRMSTGYRLVDGRLVARPFELFSNIAPAGSATATAPDMARFIQAMLNGGQLGPARILSPASVRFLGMDGFKNAPNLPGFANGFMVLREAGPRMIEHGGNTGDQHSYLLLAPEAQFGFFMSFTGGAASSDARTDLVAAIVGRVFPTERAPRWTGTETPSPMGAYRSDRRDYSRPANPRYDLKVAAAGPHALTIERDGAKSYWEQIGPRLYERVTGARDGGPYERVEFYGTAEEPKLSFASEPHMLYRLVKP
ncbi:serine hydrolase domain-containing protein [Sphingomonas quercus]|uniref:Beta-lactamase family protein n=1 Tax=Sphingomonas quercus TaxID=2842451 RepID=A0ABS6BQ25_9SPHN|nr:serine hydrolase domain-containing protein [Sphingomonas quercus]MBU3079506.1 beta-lactamase family protein [Sphingomonas quercus]